ncbi:methyltransferase domain-containing protein [Streptomyces alkaliphilus]|uniref:methyltransferase domain-containing protein n=1 Tax=Streptomyces alkaliphilus TaxID=1472722 RepID=UPI00118087CA|nr:methyltransferase domain-containing protein [Streptomyces alkaliphilus]MQS06502.1 methyltransferase domain-containing protein [Streptomyces alkaliphilus]
MGGPIGEGREARDVDREAARLRHDLVSALVAAGALPDPAWRTAFEEVPRHLFVPRFYDPSGLRIDRHDHPDLWLRGVHEDRALVTHRRGGEPISSSSQPSLMASMLHDLDVRDGDRILEVGTGTGWNAALLAHRVGDHRVTSVDLDPELTATARAHLAAAGRRPRVVTADGSMGWPAEAPYDRIIATCRIDAVPLPWLRQLTVDGLLVAPLGYAVIRLRRTGPDRATGRFRGGAWFMPLRTGRSRPGMPAVEPDADDPGRPAEVTPRAATDPDFRFWADLCEPGVEWRMDPEPGAGPGAVALRGMDGSTARLGRNGMVVEAGPRRLWSEVERLYRVWDERGRPGPERFGVSVEGRHQRLWIDTPDGPGHELGEPVDAVRPG